MFWAGRVNSILVIVTFGGTFLIGILSSPLNGVAWFFFMLFVRIAIKLLDLFWTAITGDPLIYQTKILASRKGSDE